VKKRKGTTARPVVIVKCVQCNKRREIGPGEIPNGEVPMCDECYVPMVPVRAELKQDFLGDD
jgi:NAD-dependent SIR2 family protein deacetylase